MTSPPLLWRSFACSIKELRLDITLACGQSFRWKETSPGEWTSVLKGMIWTLKQDDNSLFYRVFDPERSTFPDLITPLNSCHPKAINGNKITKIKLEQPNDGIKTENCNELYDSILRDYFQLSYSLEDLYAQWSSADSNFKEVASTFTGVRILRQDPTENLFSFICSSNNHISRISGMVERMCEAYGDAIGEVDGVTYYAFPHVERLAGEGVEEKLRALGFGYRAKYISKSAKIICQRGDGWLHSLRGLAYDDAKEELMTLCGVGAKVADCVCLMSLDHLGAIPVDTHVWQIAARHYMSKLNTAKSLTPVIYKQIGDHFRTRWGELAGWAHSVLFSADLKKFKDLKPVKDTKPVKKEKLEKPEEKVSTETNQVKLEETAKTSPRKRQQAPVKATKGKRRKR